MTRTIAFCAVLVFLAGAGIYAVGQQAVVERGPTGSFAVCSLDKSAVLVDTRTGQTWLLRQPTEKMQPPVWLPAAKVDSLEEGAKWLAAEQQRAKVTREIAAYE